MRFDPRWIIGKTVARVNYPAQPARDRGPDHSGAHPATEIHFTDGSSIAFVTEETDWDWYGTQIVYRKPEKR
jgi:hypothetical protein